MEWLWIAVCFLLGFITGGIIVLLVMAGRINDRLDGSFVVDEDEKMPYFFMNDSMDKLEDNQIITLKVVKQAQKKQGV